MNESTSPTGNALQWGVCAVSIPRESYYWLKDWIDHYIKAGASRIVIYDNTGSTVSLRKSSIFKTGRYQQMGMSKRGEHYAKLTRHLTDAQICRELRDLAACYDGKVEIVTWQPRHPQTGVIVHGQIEAYCDFIRRYRDLLDWGLFCDLDEYIYCTPGLHVGPVLELVERQKPQVSQIQLLDWLFECRWADNGPKDITTHTLHHASKHGSGKTIAKLRDVTHVNIHLRWRFRKGKSKLFIDREDMGIVHYNQQPRMIGNNGVELIRPRDFLDSAPKPGARPRLLPQRPRFTEGESPAPVDTTFATFDFQPLQPGNR